MENLIKRPEGVFCKKERFNKQVGDGGYRQTYIV